MPSFARLSDGVIKLCPAVARVWVVSHYTCAGPCLPLCPGSSVTRAVSGTVCLRKWTDKTKLSLWLQGEEENSRQERDRLCFKQVLLAITPVMSVERC